MKIFNLSFPKPLVKNTIYFIPKNRTLKNYLCGILNESMFIFKVDAKNANFLLK